MGCPNWKIDTHTDGSQDKKIVESETGIIMIAHAGCGTWTRRFSDVVDNLLMVQGGWKQCFVDSYYTVQEARFCIPDSQTWDFIPLSALFSATVDGTEHRDNSTILLLPTCCGRYVQFLRLHEIILQPTRSEDLDEYQLPHHYKSSVLFVDLVQQTMSVSACPLLGYKENYI